MSLELGFSVVVLAGLVCLIYFLHKVRVQNIRIIASGLTILLYRTTTFITIGFFGRFPEEPKALFTHIDHKYLGTFVLLVTFFLRNKLPKKTKNIFYGIGWGMVIDEISEILVYMPFTNFPVGFRDTLPDLLLILFFFAIYALASYKFFKE